jgi:hypothetical protein
MSPPTALCLGYIISAEGATPAFWQITEDDDTEREDDREPAVIREPDEDE